MLIQNLYLMKVELFNVGLAIMFGFLIKMIKF